MIFITCSGYAGMFSLLHKRPYGPYEYTNCCLDLTLPKSAYSCLVLVCLNLDIFHFLCLLFLLLLLLLSPPPLPSSSFLFLPPPPSSSPFPSPSSFSVHYSDSPRLHSATKRTLYTHPLGHSWHYRVCTLQEQLNNQALLSTVIHL